MGRGDAPKEDGAGPVQPVAMGRGFETKPTQPIEYIDEIGKSLSARNGSKLPFLERSQLAFEVCHS